MVKGLSKFVCQQCGHEETKWFGKCPDCGNWNSAVETVVSSKSLSGSTRGRGFVSQAIKPISLSSISSKSTARISTKISELDRVLGGGLTPGQVVLIAGEPGIGKSTLLLQVSDKISSNDTKQTVMYASGEESSGQIKIRANRLGIRSKNINLIESTDVDNIIDSVASVKLISNKTKAGISLLIIDSIQTMTTSNLLGMAGSVGQVRECAYRLVRFAKENNVPVFIVGHVTKQGSVAGPSVLMHIVDTVLWFEGDKGQTYRFLRSVKNRFGSTDEVGVFSMEEKGLEPVGNPEKIFLSEGKDDITGTVVASVLQGSRPLLVEVQSLVVPTKLAIPRRVAQGVDPRRFELLLAVLTRRAGLPLYDNDCFVNVAGGISIKGDPSADLAICLSVASAYFDKALAKGNVAMGEVGLLGDIRQVIAQEKREKEAKRLGYKNIISNKNVKYLRQAIRKYIGK
jgi:DNA repair protein RadA/Sms